MIDYFKIVKNTVKQEIIIPFNNVIAVTYNEEELVIDVPGNTFLLKNILKSEPK